MSSWLQEKLKSTLFSIRNNPISTALFAFLIGYLLYTRLPLWMETGEREGEPAPHFQVVTLSGEEYSLSSLKGKNVVLNFWATWCPPCRLEIPILSGLHEDLKDENYVMLSITSEDPSVVEKFVQEEGIEYPVVIDSGNSLSSLYRVAGYPTFVYIDEEGRIEDIDTGFNPLLFLEFRWRVK